MEEQYNPTHRKGKLHRMIRPTNKKKKTTRSSLRRRRRRNLYFVTLSLILTLAGFLYTAATVYVNSSAVALGTDISILETQRQQSTLVISLLGQSVSLDLSVLSRADAVGAEHFALIPAPLRLAIPLIDTIGDRLEEWIDL